MSCRIDDTDVHTQLYHLRPVFDERPTRNPDPSPVILTWPLQISQMLKCTSKVNTSDGMIHCPLVLPQSKLTQFLRAGCGYKPSDMVFVPISGLYGTNIKDPVEQKTCPWYKGGTLFSVRFTGHLPETRGALR